MDRFWLLVLGVAALPQTALAANLTQTDNSNQAIPENCQRSRNLPKGVELVQLSNGKKYYFQLIPVHPFLRTWSVANATCAQFGLHLATIRNETDMKVVWEHANAIEDYLWWVSAKNFGTKDELDFRWQDGSKLEKDSELWSTNSKKAGDCIFVKDYKLRRDDCDCFIRYICELPTECY